MITFKLKDQSINFPTSWFDVTFTQYLGLLKPDRTFSETLSILTGVEISPNDTILGIEALIQAMSFLSTAPKFPASVNMVGEYHLPTNNKGAFDIQLESLGQFEDMRNIMIKVPEKDVQAHTKAYASYVAIYLQKIRDKEYDSMKAKEMVDDVMKMPAYQVLTVGGFFFLKVWSLSTGTAKTFPPTSPSPKKSKRVLTPSPKNSGRTAK